MSRCESIIPPLPILITHNTHISQGEKNKRRSLQGFTFIPALERARSQRKSGGPAPGRGWHQISLENTDLKSACFPFRGPRIKQLAQKCSAPFQTPPPRPKEDSLRRPNAATHHGRLCVQAGLASEPTRRHGSLERGNNHAGC